MLGHHYDLDVTELSNRPILLMEEERHRLARELHDDLLQHLTALSLQLDLCRRLCQNSSSAALIDELALLKGCWQQSLATMGELVEESNPRFWQGGSLSGAVLRLARDWEERTNIEVSVDLRHLPESRLGGEQGVALIYIVTEALRNAGQHAGASCVTVWAEDDAETLRVFVRDDGVGFDLNSVAADYPRQGLGLAGMRERARGAGGELSIESEPGLGTTLTLVLPLRGLTERGVRTSPGRGAIQ
jgi:two-component system sensor histidine kinase DegS